jgi:hypothetical protein
MDATDDPVVWAYEVWACVVSDLRHKDNHVRAIAGQLLCNLAKSDPELRICGTEKNWSLIRFDVVQSMRDVYDVTGAESSRTTAQELIDSEADVKYRKKYAGLWKM